jgi:hypothetical protein
MKSVRLLSLILLLVSAAPARAIPDPTHTGQLDLELHLTNEKGRTEKLVAQDGKLTLNWDSRACELVTRNARYSCKLDVSQDLLGPGGEILIQALPKVHFEPKTLETMLANLGTSDKKSVRVIYGVIQESAPARTKGFDVPFYVLNETEGYQPGQPPKFWSAFAGLYLDHRVQAPQTLGPQRSFTLRFHFHGLKAVKGAFDITGNNDAGNFGNE